MFCERLFDWRCIPGRYETYTLYFLFLKEYHCSCYRKDGFGDSLDWLCGSRIKMWSVDFAYPLDEGTYVALMIELLYKQQRILLCRPYLVPWLLVEVEYASGNMIPKL